MFEQRDTDLLCTFLGFPIKNTFFEEYSSYRDSEYEKVIVYSKTPMPLVVDEMDRYVLEDDGYKWKQNNEYLYELSFHNNWVSLFRVIKKLKEVYSLNQLEELIDLVLDGEIIPVYKKCLELVKQYDK